LVGDGRKELVDQIAVGGMDLDNVEAGFVCALRRICESANRRLNISLRHLARHGEAGTFFGMDDRARGDGRPGFEGVVDLVLFGLVETLAPGDRCRGLATSMGELDARGGSL